MAENNSIFEFGEKFGYESPFNNWVEEFGKLTDPPKITSVNVLKNFLRLSILELANDTKKEYLNPIPVSLIINVKGNTDKVEVEFNGIKRNAFKSVSYWGSYEAIFDISVPPPYQKKEFTFKISVFDLYTKKIVDTREINVTANLDGSVKEITGTEKNDKQKGKIKFVIDPGHGYTKGNTGAICYIYTHKIKGEDGKPVLDDKKEFKTTTNDITKLPTYVINDPDEWIISKKEDQNHNERILVYDVSVKLKELLEKNNYICFITRNSRVVNGNDDEKTRKARIDLANLNNVDYFISIHADGSDDIKSTGAHVVYPKTTDMTISEYCKSLSTDIFQKYNVINVEKASPKEDTRGLQVLSSSNLTKRKVLVELGFVTNPKDASLMFSNIDRIALQLFEGITINVNKNFPQ